MTPHTPHREDSVNITPTREEYIRTHQASEDEVVVVTGQEVKPQGSAKEEAREDDYKPTHEHTRVLGCANVTDIVCRIARMPNA